MKIKSFLPCHHPVMYSVMHIVYNSASPTETEVSFLRGEHSLDRLPLEAAMWTVEEVLCFLLLDLVLQTFAYPYIIRNCYYTACTENKFSILARVSITLLQIVTFKRYMKMMHRYRKGASNSGKK